MSSKLWNQEKYEQDWHNYPEVRRLPQSKGNRPMQKIPERGDTVLFIFRGRVVMEGTVDSDGFENGINHQHHSCNIGNNRDHTIHAEFAWVNVTEVGLSRPVRTTGQQTWIQWKDDMYINNA